MQNGFNGKPNYKNAPFSKRGMYIASRVIMAVMTVLTVFGTVMAYDSPWDAPAAGFIVPELAVIKAYDFYGELYYALIMLAVLFIAFLIVLFILSGRKRAALKVYAAALAADMLVLFIFSEEFSAPAFGVLSHFAALFFALGALAYDPKPVKKNTLENKPYAKNASEVLHEQETKHVKRENYAPIRTAKGEKVNKKRTYDPLSSDAHTIDIDAYNEMTKRHRVEL